MSKDGIQPEGATYADQAWEQARGMRGQPDAVAQVTALEGILIQLGNIAFELQEANTIAWTLRAEAKQRR